MLPEKKIILAYELDLYSLNDTPLLIIIMCKFGIPISHVLLCCLSKSKLLTLHVVTRQHNTLTQCWFNVGPPSTTLAQR